EAVTAIEVEAARGGGQLRLSYIVRGAIANLRLPAAAAPARADNLWQHTCFEVFIGSASTPVYYEFNFSPSTEWAAYSFSHYREGMRNLEIAAPIIEARSAATRCELSVALDATNLPKGLWRVAISAVIEELNGHKTYWALAHAAAKPDFHNIDSFIFELPA
ncbi:MAG TPA: DOMON-like domain-containing protein, partial [Alphaproteobacteria bacterium]|nr:DOMON-like domain-containing protein [Alphaproteobacteria bacterium]